VQLLNAQAVDAAVLNLELAEIRVAASSATGGVALVLMDGDADSSIEDNNITGAVSLYGEPGTLKMTADDLHKASDLIKKGNLVFAAASTSFHFRNNLVSRIDVSEKTVSLLKGVNFNTTTTLGHVYRRCFITNNVFSGGNSVFVMDHLALTANSFDEDRLDAGNVIAKAAVYAGNYASNDIRLFSAAGAREKAANLMINIVDI
jgi:hypothetical protein